MSELVYLVLGSNIPPKVDNLKKGVALLHDYFPSSFTSSSFYFTQPYNSKPQSTYLNLAVKFSTDKSCSDVLRIALDIEKIIGRKRSSDRFDSRVIDIDIVLFGAECINKSRLIVPHYDMRNRDFFLVPILELDKLITDPVSGQKLSFFLDKIPTIKRTNPKRL
jgi:2-amino-4-hydroxy-6-hydroxymethyldihydropteridine diphosphokinase